MPRRFYLPTTQAEQIAFFNNFISKIAAQAAVLGWNASQVTIAQNICTQMVTAFTYADEARTTMQAVSAWKDLIFNGDPVGTVAPAPPEFNLPPDGDFSRGCLKQFSKLREQIMSNNNYTDAMGEILGLIGPEVPPIDPSQTQPNLKMTVTGEGSFTGTDSLVISGSMQNNGAMKVMYTPKGGVPREVAFVTSLPATITITKTDPNEPESGTIQAQFYKKNQPVGTPSPSYPVTLT